ncbi:protein O-mannosyl-transferase TMTC4-like isoform X1 [Antedon mediterranea]|uniref:protein O-mannosyl-transferase TMTC4-like isoform X1 n=1 Tax=Antedon mediterranea TaxID=105859 RepID=UPI003AF8E6AC
MMLNRNNNNYTQRRFHPKQTFVNGRHVSNTFENNNHVFDWSSHQASKWDSNLPVPNLSFRWAVVIVVTFAFACYVNSIPGTFVFDDLEAVVNNKDVLPGSSWFGIFQNDFWGKKLYKKESHKSYRPIPVLTFRLNYWLSGGLNPLGFHITNVLLHMLVSAMSLPVCSILLGGVFKGYNWNHPRASLLCSLLFAVHPVHTESVSAIVGRADLLCAVLFFSSFLLYVSSLKKDNPCHPPRSFNTNKLLLSMLACMVSMLCKEQGLTVIGLCSAYDILVACRLTPQNIFRAVGIYTGHKSSNMKDKMSASSPWIQSLLKRHFILFTSGIAMATGRYLIMGRPPTFQPVDNPASFSESLLVRIINYNYVYSLNVWLLLQPSWLCFDWAMGCISLIQSATDPRLLAVLLFWLSLATILYKAIYSPPSQNQRVLTIGLAAMIIPFLPATNIFFRVGFVIAERVLYLPSLGFAIIVTLGFNCICNAKPRCRMFILIGISCLLSSHILRCIQRNHDWLTEDSLYYSGLTVCPNNAKVHYNIAKSAVDKGNIEEAIFRYRSAIQLSPNYGHNAMNNLANILKDRGEMTEAELLLKSAVEIRPEFAAAWMNLGILQAALKKYDQAETSYLTALMHRRKYPDCYFNLGNLFLDLHRHDDALQAWLNASSLQQDHAQAWSNTILLLDNLGQFETAESVAEEALKHLPNEASIYFALANVYGKSSRYEDSEKNYQKAISLNPNTAFYHGNLGVLYHRWGKHKKAEQQYRLALSIHPETPNTQDNLRKLENIKAKHKNNL